MNNAVVEGQLQALIQELFVKPVLKDDSNIISLSSNELADIYLNISTGIRKKTSIDQLLKNTVNLLGQAGIAERVLLVQISELEEKIIV